MASKRSADRKRQTKINFSPTPQPKRKKVAKARSLSDDDSSPLPASKRAKVEEAGRDRGLRLGMPVKQKIHGMFESSDVDMASPDSSETESDSEDEVQVVSVKRTRGHTKIPEPSDDEEEGVKRQNRRPVKIVELSEDEEVVKSQRKGRRSNKRVPTPEEDSHEDTEHDDNGDEEDELKEDLAFLKSSPLPERGRLRSTQDKPLNERQRALEALKKRRGGTQEEPSSSATPRRSRPVVVESDSDLEVIQEEEASSELSERDSEEGSEEEEEVTAYDVFRKDIDDENFIVDDDEDLIGAPADDAILPIEFSQLSRAKPRELFKYAIEWMVQKKINPGFSSSAEIYKLAFRKLEDEVQGLANSKFSSSAWTSDFSRAIRARPDADYNEIARSRREVIGDHCEACNRKNHPASWEVTFTGKPYNKDTLEPLVDDSDTSSSSGSDSDSDSSLSADSETELNGEKPTYNANGERIPPESKIFTVGSTCKANAQTAHTLLHWRYHLNAWVLDYLVRKGHCSPEELVKRDKWTDRKREKLALKILGKMEEEKEITKLHILYKDQLKFATEVNNHNNRAWGRN